MHIADFFFFLVHFYSQKGIQRGHRDQYVWKEGISKRVVLSIHFDVDSNEFYDLA